ncbi:MAG: hypothetical protein ABFC77_10055 [Thermoguttaceae bacterium]
MSGTFKRHHRLEPDAAPSTGIPTLYEADTCDANSGQTDCRIHDHSASKVAAHGDVARTSRMHGDVAPRAEVISTGDSEELIGFEEAARILGIGERNLRKIIQRSRERIDGKWTSGPTIRFFQCHAKAAIKFRRKWLDDFIDGHTHDPSPTSFRQADVRQRNGKNSKAAGLGCQGRDSEPELGFDSELYDL